MAEKELISPATRLRRGEVAKLTGLGGETIRYYEKIGLLQSPPRSSSGYRNYPSSVISRLSFVQSAKKLGFSLEEIRELLMLRDTKGHPCADVKTHAARKIREIEQKISELERIRIELSTLLECCEGDGVTEKCVILRSLEESKESIADSNNNQSA